MNNKVQRGQKRKDDSVAWAAWQVDFEAVEGEESGAECAEEEAMNHAINSAMLRKHTQR